jgi:hypothetical protein
MTDETDNNSEQQPPDSAQEEPAEDTHRGDADEQEGVEDPVPAATGDVGSGAPDPEDDPMVPDQSTGEDTVPDDDEMGEAFDDMAVDEVEADEVWATVAEEEEGSLSESDETAPGESPVEANVAEVSKHDYCEGCEYLSEAPEIHCTHEGTEILDFVDMDNVRVSNCPIVAERQGLEQGVSKGSTGLGDVQRE